MNNPESVKLEVFTVALKPLSNNQNNTLKDVLLNTPGINPVNDLFSEFVQLFINHIDSGYTELRNKAFTLSTDITEYGFDTTNENIWGVVKGGSKGSGKTKSPITNREEEEDLEGTVINDKYFFYLHFPLESNLGYLFFQIYGGASIRGEFMQHITDLFKISGKYNKAVPHPILPNCIRDEFKGNSKIIEMNYITNVLSSSLTEETAFSNLCDKYHIEISIKPTGSNTITPDKVPVLNRIFSSLSLKSARLSDSVKKKVVLQNLATKKTSKFELDTHDVMPRIYLNGRVNFDDNGIPDFSELKSFCDSLLRELIEGHYSKIERQ
ncbi:hypothetical protein JI750_12980 [Flavobacterium sp. GN10]|uniref:Uncharacterized protein n=1 Tax=Flavobacterium tagetis TaxID=2801336 RepID=A0ABS1KGK7_9FLAO|nr:hypothetical protein [Flavobacterium tagetis]MBL0737812.1 hypothetical protein [Flavobacterium tagetis]